jgi:chromosome segregation ATPase|tara:strand:+ start:216 stop:722 length:507 start_codon:yes stop_codon:yes gene_type:complete
LNQALINKYSGNLSEIKRRISVAEATITTLKAQEAALADSKAKPDVAKEQGLKIKVLISQQEDIIKLEAQDQESVEKALAEVNKEWKSTTAAAGKLKRATTRSQEAYEDAQKKLRKQVDVKAKIDEFRKKVATGKKTLEQKYTQITKIMKQIKQEVEDNKKKLVTLTE